MDTQPSVLAGEGRGQGVSLGKPEIARQKWEDGRPKPTWMATVTQAMGR